jgi:hypothetical protein
MNKYSTEDLLHVILNAYELLEQGEYRDTKTVNELKKIIRAEVNHQFWPESVLMDKEVRS